MKEEAGHKGKRSFKEHKWRVWHKALREMLKSLEQYSRDGYSFVGADGVKRVVYPCVLILSADYEEQYVLEVDYE